MGFSAAGLYGTAWADGTHWDGAYEAHWRVRLGGIAHMGSLINEANL